MLLNFCNEAHNYLFKKIKTQKHNFLFEKDTQGNEKDEKRDEEENESFLVKGKGGGGLF